jgi:hypothetical protein
MTFTKEDLIREGISCDKAFDTDLVTRMNVEIKDGTYTFPDNLSIRELSFLFQQGVPIKEASDNAGILFFLERTIFWGLPVKRQCRILKRLSANPKGRDLYVDWNEFARVVKINSKQDKYLKDLYNMLLTESENTEEMEKRLHDDNRIPATVKWLFYYRYLRR